MENPNPADDDFVLPKLSEKIKITRAPPIDGEPYWTVHHPLQNTYHKIDWLFFECLARFPAAKTALDLKNQIETQTPLKISLKEIKEICLFLAQHKLLDGAGTAVPPPKDKKQSFFNKILHGYLYFTLPLFRPAAFLQKTYPYVSFAFHPLFYKTLLGILVLLILATLPALDQFFNTFMQLLSFEGVAAIMVTFLFIKIVHELAHAYAAHRNGVKVAHMGVAFIVLYPVLYTETTGGWEIPTRRGRLEIGLAGVVAELCLAAIFLLGWHLFPDGSLYQSVCFLVVTVSLIGSLVVNLNPLMKFDGYYVFSDLTGIDNLQHRSCQFAKWRLRRILFGWNDPPPEQISSQRIRFLTAFGTALIIYRFFIFLGIAFLVYHLFFQPLGFFLMCVELAWFIGLPIWNEVKIWWRERARLLTHKNGVISATLLIALILFLIVPWQTTLVLPAIAHSGSMQTLYAPVGSVIESIPVYEGQNIEKGDVLMTLSSESLLLELKQAEQEFSKLSLFRRQAINDPALRLDPSIAPERIESARIKRDSLMRQKDALTLRAEEDGVLRELNHTLHVGQAIPAGLFLAHVIRPEDVIITAYATDSDMDGLIAGKEAIFLPKNNPENAIPLRLSAIAPTPQSPLRWPELSSIHGGIIPSDPDPTGRAVIPRRAVYALTLTPADTVKMRPAQVEIGYIRIKSAPKSILWNKIKELNLRAEIETILP